jgi:hypothetical protein
MYGQEDSDPVVQYYDIAFGITGKDEEQHCAVMRFSTILPQAKHDLL